MNKDNEIECFLVSLSAKTQKARNKPACGKYVHISHEMSDQLISIKEVDGPIYTIELILLCSRTICEVRNSTSILLEEAVLAISESKEGQVIPAVVRDLLQGAGILCLLLCVCLGVCVCVCV